MISEVVVKKECSAHISSRVDPSKASPPATTTATIRKDLLPASWNGHDGRKWLPATTVSGARRVTSASASNHAL
jgi:hypothetical protein